MPSYIIYPSSIIIHPVLSDFLVLLRPSSWDTQRGSSAAEARGSGSWGPGVSSFKTKRLGCETRCEKTFAVVPSLERAVVRRNVIRQRPKNPCTTRQWGPWNYCKLWHHGAPSQSTFDIFWQFQWQPDPTQGAQSCKIPIKLQFSLLAPALLILGLPLLFSSFLAAWRLDVRLPDKWGKPNFSQGPWSRGAFQPQTVALWIRKCKGALVFVGRCRFKKRGHDFTEH